MTKQNNKKEYRVLGIDPGTNVMGYGLIDVKGRQITVLEQGVKMLSKMDNHQLKLKAIFEKTLGLVDHYLPDQMAVEAPFFGKNVQSMLKLGRAQGVIMAAALYRDVPIAEYSPRKIKQSITGNGNASKEQVAGMLERLFKIEIPEKYLDATDGLAAAVCHHYSLINPISDSKSNSWKEFIKNNPGKISG